MPKYVHAEFIKAKADGFQIQEDNHIDDWRDMPDDNWNFIDEYNYRIKPDRIWPETTLTSEELCSFGTAFEIANAAIKQYILDAEQAKEIDLKQI